MNAETILGQLINKGHRVWYELRPDQAVPDFTQESIGANGLRRRVGGHMGPPLEVTGVSNSLFI